MSVSQLSASTQNYLKAIWSLGEWSDDPITPTALSKYLGLRVSSVSDAVRKMADQGLIEHAPYGSVKLTVQGDEYAVAMVRRHRLIETFLVTALDYSWDQVHDEAENLEHAVSDFMVTRIDEFLQHPTLDPHGDPIPGPAGEVADSTAVQLSALHDDIPARIERISDRDPGLLQHFSAHGVGIGAVVETKPGAPYSGAVELHVHGGEVLTLGADALDAVWVVPC